MKKKFKIKSLELTIDMLVAVIAEMTVEKAFAKIPMPNYSIGKTYNKSDLNIPDYKQNSTGEKITCNDSQPFGFAPIENDFQKGMLEADKQLQKVCKKPKEYIVDIDNHVCCESCNEIYLTTIDCPICEDSIAIELDDKEGECDCGIKFNLHKNERYEMILTIK